MDNDLPDLAVFLVLDLDCPAKRPVSLTSSEPSSLRLHCLCGFDLLLVAGAVIGHHVGTP